MKATDILMEEHRVIERMLDAIEQAASGAGKGTIAPQFFLETADFVRGFADGCHHRKEEGVLFKDMALNGVPVEGGPIGTMLAEHETGRTLTRQMRAAAEAWQAGDIGARETAVQAASQYVALLRQHIAKEDSILFPMANRVIPLSGQPGLEERFETVEHEETGAGVHEKYLALVDKLTAEAAQA